MARQGSVPDFNQGYSNTYHSIAGVNIKAVLAGVTFANLQAISYSVTREKAPIVTMGSPNPRGFSRGKRGIAGSMVFIMFDSHAILDVFRILAQEKGAYTFVSDKDEPRPPLQTVGASSLRDGRITNPAERIVTTEKTFNTEEPFVGKLNDGWERTTPWYIDQIPPFNVVLTGVNEQGVGAVMAVLGIEFLNEGFGISIDDIVAEQQATYVARDISPWTRVWDDNLISTNPWNVPFKRPGITGGGSAGSAAGGRIGGSI
jgi:hypothetical protein